MEKARDAKRPRVEASAEVSDAALVALLEKDEVTCSSAIRDIRQGSRCSLSFDQGESSLADAHLTCCQLLQDASVALTSVDFSGNDLAPAGCAALADALAKPTCRLKTLNMKYAAIGPEGAHEIAEALKANSSLTRLNMARNGLGWSGGTALGHSLATNSSIVSFDMSLNDIGPEGGTAIAAALSTSTSSLTELIMLRCGVGPVGGREIGEALKQNTVLRALDLTQNDLGVEGAVALGHALEVNTTLATLNVQGNRIGFGLERAAVFARSLVTNESLTWLDASQNELGPIGAEAFAEALQVNTSLEHLCLQRNALGSRGGTALGRALAVNTGLTHLDLSQNDVGADGAAALGEALKTNRALNNLNLARNDIGGGDGCLALCAGLARNTALDSLNIERNDVGPIGGAALAVAVETHASLTCLHASRNGFTEAGTALAQAIKACKALTDIDLSSNRLGPAEGIALIASIAAHRALSRAELSDNAITVLPIDDQRRLAARRPPMHLDLSNNTLSSPPLGSRADAEELQEYLRAMQAESTGVHRIRLMVAGYGGVGKTTFCAAAMRSPEELADFHSSLLPVGAWDAPAIVAWARRLSTDWSEAAATALAAGNIAGRDLAGLLAHGDDGECRPSPALEKLLDGAMDAKQRKHLAIAISSLLQKGYHSTVGAVKVEGALTLEARSDSTCARECSLVDFAGQVRARGW